MLEIPLLTLENQVCRVTCGFSLTPALVNGAQVSLTEWTRSDGPAARPLSGGWKPVNVIPVNVGPCVVVRGAGPLATSAWTALLPGARVAEDGTFLLDWPDLAAWYAAGFSTSRGMFLRGAAGACGPAAACAGVSAAAGWAVPVSMSLG